MKRKALTAFQVADDALLVTAKTVISSMTNNHNFETPTPPLNELDALYSVYNNTLMSAKQTRSVQDIEAKNVAKTALQNALSTMANYVNLIADGDLAKLTSSGFELNKIAQKHGVLEAPHAISLASVNVGQVELKIDKVQNASGYLVAYKEAGQEAWQSALFSKTNGTIKGLKSVAKYEFKVATTNSASSELNEYNYTQIATVVVQ